MNHAAGAWNGQQLQRKFQEAALRNAWTKGFESMDAQREPVRLRIEGTLPGELKGVLYRNGPARHDLGGVRYSHQWDGDGMVHAFLIHDGSVHHQSQFVETRKFLSETRAGRFLVSGYGSRLEGSPTLPGALDDANVANTNVVMHAGRLLALWEAGSAYELETDFLRTVGPMTHADGSALSPFSAHPRLERDGTLWNFGANPFKGELAVYRFAPSGELVHSRRWQIDGLPPIHDFAITEHHLVFVMPSLRSVNPTQHRPYARFFHWSRAAPTRVLTISKADGSFRWYEIPPASLLHVGNAWEDSDGKIRLSYMGHAEPASVATGWSVMTGDYRHARGPFYTSVTLDPRLRSATLQVHEGLECEFPVIDRCDVGVRSDRLLCIGRSTTRPNNVPGWDQVLLLDPDGGVLQSYRYGDDWLVEEHVFASSSHAPEQPARWIVGTALDMRKGTTALSIFDATDIGSGPVARALLPYSIPLGIHGTFHPG